MFVVRAAQKKDLQAVVVAARHLNSVNLPNDPRRVEQIIEHSERSFAGKMDATKREFLFVVAQVRDGTEAEVVGVSMVFAQHGNRKAPHIFFDVLDEERYSETLDRHFRHTVLRIGYNYRGLTEVGGLVVLPQFRGHPAQLGKMLTYMRFVYIALHREGFRDEVVSELLPPLEPDGTSVLWEALGRNFTGLSYLEADRLSRENKEFIRSLFPQDPIYASLLPPRARALIGQVGETSKPVERLLSRIGFTYAHRIDPFDGGPHFQARTDDITVVKDTRRMTVEELADDDAVANGGPPSDALVAVDTPTSPPYFKGVRTGIRLLGAGAVVLGRTAAAVLGIGAGDSVGVSTLPLAPETKAESGS